MYKRGLVCNVLQLCAGRAVIMVVPVHHLENALVSLDGLALTVEQVRMYLHAYLHNIVFIILY